MPLANRVLAQCCDRMGRRFLFRNEEDACTGCTSVHMLFPFYDNASEIFELSKYDNHT